MDALVKVCPKCDRRYDASATFCQKDGVRLSAKSRPVDPYIGQTLLDQFKIEEKIGAGGMGSVYRARQMTLNRDVAIKILHPELANDRDAVRRFKREARVSTALDHPNVVRVFLFGQLEDGSLYIVMEHLAGRSLLEVIRREGALPVHRALHIATQICEGVGEAHRQGVVHRDIKPENVVLVSRRRDSDHVKVLDFGIARVLWGDDVTQATQSGLVFGTARYISPEGAAGEPTDARSDVYSLGILTYQLLTGVTPFDAASPVQMLMKHIHADPPHLLSQKHGKNVPEPIADVVMRALIKNPDGRYEDGDAFAEALRRAATRCGFEVRGGGRNRSSIPPPSKPPPADRGTRSEPERHEPQTPRSERAPEPSLTLEGAPNPFGDEGDVSIAGLPVRRKRSRSSGIGRSLAIAFVIGALLVGTGFGVAALVRRGEPETTVDVQALLEQAQGAFGRGEFDEPRETSVLGLTDQILEVRSEDPAAIRLRQATRDRLVADAEARARADEREEALALYRRAAAFVESDSAIDRAIAALQEPGTSPPTPGVRTRPLLVVEDQEVSLVAVLEPGVEVAESANIRFVIQRRGQQIGRAIPATAAENGGYEATTTFSRPGHYRLVFWVGEGDDRLERSTPIEVRRDPDRPRRPVSHDPPPITTQGSAWTPSVAPAWTPTVDPPVVAQPPAEPPPPWTGSVL